MDDQELQVLAKLCGAVMCDLLANPRSSATNCPRRVRERGNMSECSQTSAYCCENDHENCYARLSGEDNCLCICHITNLEGS